MSEQIFGLFNVLLIGFGIFLEFALNQTKFLPKRYDPIVRECQFGRYWELIESLRLENIVSADIRVRLLRLFLRFSDHFPFSDLNFVVVASANNLMHI